MPISSFIKSKSLEGDEKVVRSDINQSVVDFLTALKEDKTLAIPEGDPVIHVSSVVSGAALFYERLRYSVDYREDYLLRRHALGRILRRRFESAVGISSAARPLLVELVHAQYLKNDSVAESSVPKVQAILDRYAEVLVAIKSEPLKNKKNLVYCFYGLAAAELDDYLVPAPEEEALVNLVRHFSKKDKPLVHWHLENDEKIMIEYIAAYRALFALDLSKIRYLLLLRFMPDWPNTPTGGVRKQLPLLLAHYRAIEAALNHPAIERLFRVFRQRTLVFHALFDLVRENPANAYSILQDKRKLESATDETCRRYYKGSRRRLYQSAFRSTIYIFLTKMVIALALEGPLEAFIYGEVASFPLLINLFFPATLMVLITTTARFPNKNNTLATFKYLSAIIYGDDRRIFSELNPPARVSAVASPALSTIYLAAFILTFGLIGTLLNKIGFTAIGIAFFLFFLSIVSFFALRIRRPVRDLFVERHQENVLMSIIDFFSLPILKVGRWISLTSARFNVFLYLFDYFLEAPIKAFLLLSEDVLGFFKEKKEDII